MRPLLLFVLLALATPAYAQQLADGARYWIFFRDRGDAPQVAVSPEAAARRALRGRTDAMPWAQADVSPGYVGTLRAMGVETALASRWLNGVTAPLTATQRAEVASLPFVREVRPVARVEQAALPEAEPIPTPVLDFGPSAFQLRFVGADRTLNANYDGTGVRLGFLDTLFDFDHPALAHLGQSGRLIGVQDFTGQSQSNYHGLATSSIAFGRAEGQLYGPANGAYAAAATTEYAPTETHNEEDYFIAGLEWLESQGVDVVSVSLGYSLFDAGEGDYTYAMLNGDTTPFTRAVDRAAALGVLMVVAAGNEGSNSWHYITAPADADSALAVGAAGQDSSRASFSGVGPTADGRTKPDVSALGVSVRFATPGGGYASGGGTSFATPLVAAVATQILQADPSLTPMEVIQLIRGTASNASNPDNELGYGILDAWQAIDVALNGEPTPPPGRTGLAVAPNVLEPGASLRLLLPALSGPATADVIDSYGRRVASLDGISTSSTSATVALPRLAAGSYYVRLFSTDDVQIERFVVLPGGN